jgi:hypothetical protein
MQRNAKNPDEILHWCESCDKEEMLTPNAGYKAGWDFPPKMGQFGVVCPRTCPDCTIDKTVWFTLMSGKEPTEKQRKAADRMMRESA